MVSKPVNLPSKVAALSIRVILSAVRLPFLTRAGVVGGLCLAYAGIMVSYGTEFQPRLFTIAILPVLGGALLFGVLGGLVSTGTVAILSGIMVSRAFGSLGQMPLK
jgi:hypothetical protein